MQLLQPAGEDGVRGLLLSGEADLLLSCCADTRTSQNEERDDFDAIITVLVQSIQHK
jgi:hypothetical protein